MVFASPRRHTHPKFVHLIKISALCILGAAVLSGCANKIKISMAQSLVADVAKATERHDDPALVLQSMPAFLLLLEGLIEENPRNANLLLTATEAYTSYATLIELDDRERAHKSFGRGKDFGLRALHKRKKLRPLLEAPFAEFSTITAHLKPGDLPAVFWTASAWGGWISTDLESMAALADLPKVIHLMEWVIGVDESYKHAAPHLFLGVYYAALPPMLGGQPDRALHHFDRSLALTEGKSLMVNVLKARYYARQIFDRELHDGLLKQVLQEHDALEASDLLLQNEMAKSMARQLLEESDAFF